MVLLKRIADATGSEGEGGLEDATLDVAAFAHPGGIVDEEVRRGDSDVVGDLELVPDFPSEGGLVGLQEGVVGADEGRLTNSSTQVVALQEDVGPLQTDIPGLALGVIAGANSVDAPDGGIGVGGCLLYTSPSPRDRG